MAFKMKGNPYKMGKVATKSALKMAKEDKESAMDLNKKSPMELNTSYKMKEAMAKMKDNSAMKQAKPDYPDIDGDGNTKESMKQAAADKKSPMEQKSSKGFMSAYNDGLSKLMDKYGKDGGQASPSEIPQADKDALKARLRSKFKKEEGKSPLEAQGIYKTGPGGSIEQVSQEEYDTRGDSVDIDSVDDGTGYIVTGNDHLRSMDGEKYGLNDEEMAKLKKNSDRFTRGSYEMEGEGSVRRAVAMDDEIQRKINAEQPLTEKEKMFQARALKNVNR